MAEHFHAEGMAVATEDMGGVVDHMLDGIFGDNLSARKRFEAKGLAREQFPKHVAALERLFPGLVIGVTEQQITEHFTDHVTRLLEEKDNRIVVFLDRYIAREVDELYPNRIFRFSLMRVLATPSSGWGMCPVIPRLGDPSFDEQLNSIDTALQPTIGGLRNASIILADDMADTLSTEKAAAELFTMRGATVEREEGIYSYRSYVDMSPDGKVVPITYAKSIQRKNTLFELRGKVLTAEQRELTPFGGRFLR